MSRRLVLGAGLAVLVSCKSTTSPGCSGTCVTIQDFAFSPAMLTIKAGTTVTWTNKDPETHTVTADGGSSGTWDSGNLVTGSAFTYKFQVFGKYTYHCAIHPTMQGMIFVK